MTEKNLNVSVLLDFYGEMLTPKQRDAIDLYYNQDLSLGEIAEQESISRQGVRDSIKRGEVFLFELEDKLKMVQTYLETMKEINILKSLTQDIINENKRGIYSKNIDTAVTKMSEIIDSYIAQNS